MHPRRVKINRPLVYVIPQVVHFHFHVPCVYYHFRLEPQHSSLFCFAYKSTKEPTMSLNDSNTGTMPSSKKKHFIPLGKPLTHQPNNPQN